MEHVVRRIQGTDGRRPLSFPDQIGIAFVFEDRHAILLAQTKQLTAPRQGHDRARWILQRGNGVNVLGSDTALAEGVKGRGQRVHAHALGIKRDTYNIDLVFPHPTYRALVGKLLHNDGIPGFEQYLVQEFDTLIGARGDEHLLGRGLDASIVRHLLHEKFAQSRIAQRTAVHVVSGEFPPLLTQGSRGGDHEVFDGNFVRVIVAANEVVRRKSSPRLGAGG